MLIFRILFFWLVVLSGGSALALDTTSSLPDTVIDTIFTTLPGTWEGRAVETPLGPMDYSINFHVCDEGVVAGMTDLSLSDHYWRFWRSGGELRLTFHTTFQDNKEPTELFVSKMEENTIWFRAPKVKLLTVSMTLAGPTMDIRVFHYEEPHVHIQLTRTSKLMTDAEREASVKKSCTTLPPTL